MRRLVLVMLAACGSDGPSGHAVLTNGLGTLTYDKGTLTLTSPTMDFDYQRLVFGKDQLRVGTVDDLDSGDSFDPTWLYVDQPPEPPAGLAWHGGALRLGAHDDTSLQIKIDGATVTFTPEGKNGIAAVVTPSAKDVA